MGVSYRMNEASPPPPPYFLASQGKVDKGAIETDSQVLKVSLEFFGFLRFCFRSLFSFSMKIDMSVISVLL